MTSYFNGAVPLYVSDAEINNLQTEINDLQGEIGDIQIDVGALQTQVENLTTAVEAIQTNLAANMVALYKNTLPFTESPLVGNTYTIVEGYTSASGDIPGSFTNPSPGVLQYNGASTFFFQINYQIAAFIDSGAFNCIFILFRNGNELTTSRQTVSMDTVTFIGANGSALTPLNPGDTITLRAQLLNSADPNVLDVFDLSLSAFKIPSI